MSIKVNATMFKRLANGRRKVLGDGTTIHARKYIALEGAPGIGKTAVIRSLAEDWGLPLITVSINQWVNAADIVGFAYKGKQTDSGFELAGEDEIPPWLPFYRIDPTNGIKVATSDTTKGYRLWVDPKTKIPEAHPAVILLDEFSAAKPQVQQAFLCVALDKVVKNFRLHQDTNFFIAYNSCDRDGFEGQTSEISAALVGANGRFDSVELIYEDTAVVSAIQKNPIISNFWKMFTEKFLPELDICNDNVVGDKNSCGRTWESLMEELSICGYDSKNFNDDAKMRVEINFSTSPNLTKKFISCVKTFDIPTGEDFLTGKVVAKTYSDAIVGINAMGTLFGFRNRSGKEVISNNENSFLQDFLNKEYPTGTKKVDGSNIIGSKKELYMVMKTSILRENLQSKPEFAWVSAILNKFEESEDNESEECEF
jgi:hypothetical protein